MAAHARGGHQPDQPQPAHPTPPIPLDVLADLQADNIDPAEAALLRGRLDTDPAARRALAALEQVREQLRGLRGPDGLGRPGSSTPASPPDPIPDLVALRITRALEDASARRPRRAAWAAAAAVAGLAAAGAVVAVTAHNTGPTGAPAQAAPPTASTATATLPTFTFDHREGIDSRVLLSALGATDPAAPHLPSLGGCLTAHGLSTSTPLLGTASITVDGRAGVLLLVPAATPPAITALVVGQECGDGAPDPIARLDIGNVEGTP